MHSMKFKFSNKKQSNALISLRVLNPQNKYFIITTKALLQLIKSANDSIAELHNSFEMLLHIKRATNHNFFIPHLY